MVESWTRGLSSLGGNSQLCHERIVLSPRTGLNGGERGQEQVRQAKRQKEEVEDRPRTNLNGGELVQSTFLVLTFAFALAFMSTFVLALILAFLSPFRGKVLTFLGCNREKRSILVPCVIIPFGAFGWAFAFAHGILSGGVFPRGAGASGALGAEGELRFAWGASFYGMPWRRHPVGNLHTRFGSPCGPVADLIAMQSIRTMGGGESGAGIVQVCSETAISLNIEEVIPHGRILPGGVEVKRRD
eukprot:symbB.v1.2.041952.t1/scaffold8919.1/size4669/1